MKRRSVLRAFGAGLAAVGAGCLGGGGEVIVSIQQDVTVDPGSAWLEEDIPDLSDSGGSIEYIVRSKTPFDVYFFADEAAFTEYDTYIKGREPDSTPPGHPKFSQTALPKDGSDLYEASTTDGGNRESVDTAGPYYFAVDHSNYRMETRVEEFDDPLTAFVDLKVVRKRSPL
ncbi:MULTISPECIES: hypothetical protein [Haloarcula]|uniref:hypothetical protein n=1 Tax=Haloarcula TaxID=2237 RepID=UPI00166E23AC|nr:MULTISPECIES: hypothetical protein [Halomicroarcula]MBX0348870.1 hypothetical protein [Halomicroarcula pellucida]MDS0278633.1 hypothetical protein [Halomicroarcula sp. S1AR25-4]